jgi:glycosyltransferase involved in cell wall biosynthesis
VLWVGTLHANKRPELLLELARRLPQHRFAMIGGPSPSLNPSAGGQPLFDAMREQAAKLPNLEFVGFLPLAQVEQWFDRACVLVNTSLYEGMPNVFLQAWARGVPTVATVDVGVPASRVTPTVEDMARELDALLTSPQAWDRASRACLEHFAHTHASSEVLARYGQLFDHVLAGPGA